MRILAYMLTLTGAFLLYRGWLQEEIASDEAADAADGLWDSYVQRGHRIHELEEALVRGHDPRPEEEPPPLVVHKGGATGALDTLRAAIDEVTQSAPPPEAPTP